MKKICIRSFTPGACRVIDQCIQDGIFTHADFLSMWRIFFEK